MGTGNENQLEFFEVGQESAPRPHRESLGRVWLQLRYDQLLLGTMAGVIGLTIVFACGVERGKQLVRADQRGRLLTRQEPAESPAPAAKKEPAKPAAKPEIIVVEAPETPAAQAAASAQPAVTVPSTEPAPALKPLPAAKPVKKEPAKAKTGKSRYAVQVRTFTKSQLAKQEMEQLRAKGEPAFIVIRDGRTVVYVGPFPSKDNAAAKSTNLRSKYSDCFVKTL
jgi:cell division protein FtsN